jgi:hypothetical protein
VPAASAGVAPAPAPAGYTRSVGFAINPKVVAWLPAVLLSVIFALTFFDWVGSYPGEATVYSQNAWRALSGRPYRNFRLEELMRKEAAWPTEVFNRTRSDWALMIPYLVVLLLALFFAWGERLVNTSDPAQLPGPLRWARRAWPHRVTVLTALAALALILVFTQAWVGFGLERAVREVVRERYAEARTAAGGDAALQDTIAFRENQELERFNLERTTWLNLVILLHVLVLLCLILRGVLVRRGDKPPPRLVLHY